MPADTKRRLLMFAYEFPPSAGGGVARLSRFASHLSELGWDVTVISAEPIDGRPRDESLLGLTQGLRVERLPARHVGHSIARTLAPLKRARGGAVSGGVVTTPVAPSAPTSSDGSAKQPLSTRLSRWVAVPDDAVLWARDAGRLAQRLATEASFDAVLASGPPFSALVEGARVASRLAIPAVLDMRDAWRDNIALRWPTGSHAVRSLALERAALSSAAAVTCVSEGIAGEAREMGAVDVTVLPNGFDPEEMPAYRPDPDGPLRMVFMGRMSRAVSDPSALFAGLAMAREAEPACAGCRLDVIGPDQTWAQTAAAAAGVADHVAFHGFKPYREALDVVATSDVGVVCIAETPGSEMIYSGKLFDYLGVGIPVLVMGPAAGVAARTVFDASAGWAVGYTDAGGAAAVIARAARDKRDRRALATPDRGKIAVFDRRSQTRMLSGIIEDAIRERVS